jgi:hypothetical protein
MVERPLLIPVSQITAIEIRCACGASVTIPLQKEMPRDALDRNKTHLEKHPTCLGCGLSLATAVLAIDKSLREFLFSANLVFETGR